MHRPQLREEWSDVIRAEDALNRTVWGEVGVCVLYVQLPVMMGLPV